MALSQELIRDLHYNGFPQLLDGEGYYIDLFIEEPSEPAGFRYVLAYEPLLHELIAACGTRFKRVELEHARHSHLVGAWTCWYWHIPTESTAMLRYVYGETPEEAVARAWLRINNKNNGETSTTERH